MLGMTCRPGSESLNCLWHRKDKERFLSDRTNSCLLLVRLEYRTIPDEIKDLWIVILQYGVVVVLCVLIVLLQV